MKKRKYPSIKLITSLKEHTGIVWSILWSISGDFLTSIGVDSSLIIWGPSKNSIARNFYEKSIEEVIYFRLWKKIFKLEMFQLLRTFRGLGRKINSNYFSVSDFKNKSYLIEVSFFKCLKICSLEIKHCIKGHSSEIKSCHFSSNEILFASCGRDRSIWFWKNQNKEKINCDFILKNLESDIKCIKWNPVYPEITGCSYDGILVIISYEKEEKMIFENRICTASILNSFFESTGKRIFLVNTVGELILIDLIFAKDSMTLKKKKSNEITTIFFFNNTIVSSLAISDKHYIISITNFQGNITIMKNKKLTQKFDSKKNKISHVELDYNLKPFLSTPQIHFGKINLVNWHPIFDNIFASCGDDSIINVCKFE
jgi:WD40 repeat protein